MMIACGKNYAIVIRFGVNSSREMFFLCSPLWYIYTLEGKVLWTMEQNQEDICLLFFWLHYAFRVTHRTALSYRMTMQMSQQPLQVLISLVMKYSIFFRFEFVAGFLLKEPGLWST